MHGIQGPRERVQGTHPTVLPQSFLFVAKALPALLEACGIDSAWEPASQPQTRTKATTLVSQMPGALVILSTLGRRDSISLIPPALSPRPASKSPLLVLSAQLPRHPPESHASPGPRRLLGAKASAIYPGDHVKDLTHVRLPLSPPVCFRAPAPGRAFRNKS